MVRGAWVAGWLVLGAAGLAAAQSPSPTPSPTPGASSARRGSPFASNQINGRIRTIDRAAKTIAIEGKGQTQELTLTENATVFLEGRLGTWEDLSEGQQVRAAFEERQGQRTIRWIEVTPGTSPAPRPPTRAEAATPPDQTASEPASPLTGRVVAVDAENGVLRIDQRGTEVSLRVPAEASVTIDGEQSQLEHLKEGQEVRASFEPGQEGMPQVTQLETVQPEATGQPTPSPAPTAPQSSE